MLLVSFGPLSMRLSPHLFLEMKLFGLVKCYEL